MEELYKKDSLNYKKFLKNLKDDIRKGYQENPRNILENIKRDFNKVIVCGMGGSGIAADVLKIYLEETPIDVVKDYKLPLTVNKKDLVIISSYSGNTEEAISCFRDARRKELQSVILTSGGKLTETGLQTNTPVLKLPLGYPPRATLGYTFSYLIRILEELGIIKSKEKEIGGLIEYLSKKHLEKLAIDLSEKVVGKTPLIYASPKYYPIAYRWKTQFNENSKIHAFSSEIPELNHNELEGYNSGDKKYHVFLLVFDDDFSRIKKRTTITKEQISTKGVTATELEIKGNILAKIFSSILLGDWISYYTALKLGVDPTPVDFIEDFKKKMGPFV